MRVKSYLISALIFVILLSIMAINENRFIRMLLLVPILISFFLSLILLGLEYEKQKDIAWKKKEQKLKEKMYDVLQDFQKKLKYN